MDNVALYWAPFLHPENDLTDQIFFLLPQAKFLLYLVTIVEYNFAEGTLSGTCSLGTLLKTAGLDSSCGFVVKVGFSIFLYKLTYYGVICVIALPKCFVSCKERYR